MVGLIVAAGGKAFAVPTDVAVAQQIQALVAARVAQCRRLDIAFSNAGIEAVMNRSLSC